LLVAVPLPYAHAPPYKAHNDDLKQARNKSINQFSDMTTKEFADSHGWVSAPRATRLGGACRAR